MHTDHFIASINARRLRDYPRLMLFTTWIILIFNLVFHQGWLGAFGQLIGVDFLTFYAAGSIYLTNPILIYDAATQMEIQQSIIHPTILNGYGPYMNPPYVAPFYTLWTHIPYPWAIALWTILALLSVIISIRLLINLAPPENRSPILSFTQLIVITLSFFPFIEGLQAGQNHWITLLLISGITLSMMKEKWYLSGFLAGLLIYKPQFLIGLLIIWLIWKNYKALISFGLAAIAWIGLFILQNGTNILLTYTQLSQEFMALPYTSGFPRYILVTVYGFLTSLFPKHSQPILGSITTILMILGGMGLVWLAYKLRKHSMTGRIPAIVAAIIFPLLVTPYALLHDLVILIPAFVILSIYLPTSRSLLLIAILVYFGAFFFTLLGAVTNLAWVSLLVIAIAIVFIIWVINDHKNFLQVVK